MCSRLFCWSAVFQPGSTNWWHNLPAKRIIRVLFDERWLDFWRQTNVKPRLIYIYICSGWLGHFFLENNFPSSNGHLLGFRGGSKPLKGLNYATILGVRNVHPCCPHANTTTIKLTGRACKVVLSYCFDSFDLFGLIW